MTSRKSLERIVELMDGLAAWTRIEPSNQIYISFSAIVRAQAPFSRFLRFRSRRGKFDHCTAFLHPCSRFSPACCWACFCCGGGFSVRKQVPSTAKTQLRAAALGLQRAVPASDVIQPSLSRVGRGLTLVDLSQFVFSGMVPR